MITATLIQQIYKERGSKGRPPSLRQIKTVAQYLAENGGKSKRQVIKEMGYGQEAIDNPKRVFSRSILEVLDKVGVTEFAAAETVKENLTSHRLEHFTFPPYNAEADKIDNGKGYRTAEKKGEQLTDKEIIEMLDSVNCTVKKIVHGDMVRHVYYWTPDSKTQLAAADMIFKLMGSYAPAKVEGKHQIGVFSMGELRKKMKQKGIKIII